MIYFASLGQQKGYVFECHSWYLYKRRLDHNIIAMHRRTNSFQKVLEVEQLKGTYLQESEDKIVQCCLFDLVNFESAKLKLARIWWSHGFSTLVVGWFHETKVAVRLDFVQMKGGRARALPKFFCHLFISAFLVNKRSLFPKNANNFNSKLFFRFIQPKKAIILPLFKKNFGYWVILNVA